MSCFLQPVAAAFRRLYSFAHSAHLNAGGPIFEADHKLYKRLYEFAIESFDAVAERSIALQSPVDMAAAFAVETKSVVDARSSDNRMAAAKKLVSEVLSEVERAAGCPSVTVGTNNLLAGLADRLEQFVFHISRRVQ